MIGISLFTLWLSEIIVSVATTPGISWILLFNKSIRLSLIHIFVESFPILFLVVLLISAGTAMTGLIIRFTPLIISGFAGMILSSLCLILRTSLDSILVFAALFLLVQVIPGHILNYKSRKSHV